MKTGRFSSFRVGELRTFSLFEQLTHTKTRMHPNRLRFETQHNVFPSYTQGHEFIAYLGFCIVLLNPDFVPLQIKMKQAIMVKPLLLPADANQQIMMILPVSNDLRIYIARVLPVFLFVLLQKSEELLLVEG